MAASTQTAERQDANQFLANSTVTASLADAMDALARAAERNAANTLQAGMNQIMSAVAAGPTRHVEANAAAKLAESTRTAVHSAAAAGGPGLMSAPQPTSVPGRQAQASKYQAAAPSPAPAAQEADVTVSTTPSFGNR